MKLTAASQPSPYGPLEDLEPKHGTCHDVPPPYDHKPVLSTLRNPYDWYVSQYEFAWWKRTFMYPPDEQPTPVGYAIEQALPQFQADHPEFPDVSFADFVQLCDRASLTYDAEAKFGIYSHGFIQYFYHNAVQVAAQMDHNYIRSGKHQADRFDVKFLRTHHLNQELYDYLLAMGYAEKDIAFIHNMGKVLPMGRGREEHQVWQQYYTPELKTFIREREWPLFEMFPEFDS